jgi:preprotein translocase subunit YajC
MLNKNNKVKTYETKLVQGQILKNITYGEKREGVSIRDLPTGTRIKTGGGLEGVITGKQTRNEIQIQINTDQSLDWISKDAFVTV